MTVNISKSPIVIGRFRVMPGAKVPAVAVSEDEQEMIDRLVKKGLLKVETAESKPVEKPAVEAPAEEAVEDGKKPAGKSRKSASN